MLKPLASSDARLLREFFAEARYGPELILREPLLRDLGPRRAGRMPEFFAGLRERSTSNLLLAWFYLGERVSCEAVHGFISAHVLARMIDCGMLISSDGQLASPIMLTPHREFLFASDNSARWQSQPDDMVIWPNPTSQLLDRFTMRLPVGSTLDLGAGCGIQAILAAQHSRHVTATDLNPRAAEFTRFNAWLNGVTNIACLTGDTFEPVRGRCFDLIVANLPFFVTPTSGRLYCENSMELDGYCRHAVQKAARHLNECGYAQMTLEWVQVRGETWQDRLHGWVHEIGCDVFILHTYARPAPAYARERIEQSPAGAAQPDALERWLDHYRDKGVEQIHGGVLALRRRSGHNWIRTEDSLNQPREPFGDSIARVFACMDFAESYTADDDVLEACLLLAPDAQLHVDSTAEEGRWQPANMTLQLTAGLPASIALSPAVADFLVRLDGRQTLARVIAAFAAGVSASPEVVERDCLAVARQLLAGRFLLPVGSQISCTRPGSLGSPMRAQ